jgi:hypothetical protein
MKMSKMDLIEVETRKLELETGKFELEQRQAKALSISAFFPDNLKNDIASAVIVYDLAKRMDISVMEVSQSIFIIYGRPSFATTFLVARLNQSGRIQGALKTIVSADKQEAYCVAVDAESGEELAGMTVTMGMARKEGWVGKKGSKWVNMPELMLRKRSQSFFIKEYFPEVMFGLSAQEEMQDVEAIEAVVINATDDINQALMNKPTATIQPKATPKKTAPVGKNEEEVARNEAIGEAQQTAVVEKPKTTRMPRYITQHYAKLEECGVKRKDLKPFAEHMDFENMGEEKVTSFFTQTDAEITFYVNDFYGIEQGATEAEVEEIESPNEPTASQGATESQTQESNTQEPKAGVSMARYTGVMIGKGIKAEDVDEFFSWCGVDTSNVAEFMQDLGAVDSLVEQFNTEAGYAND